MTYEAGIDVLSVVVPVYNEAAAIPPFVDRVIPLLSSVGMGWELIFVNDGSIDGTLATLLSYAKTERGIRIVDLSRNFGKEAAMTAGLESARGNAVVIMDVDLQDPPELIGEMLEKWRAGYQVVYCRRSRRDSDTWLKRATAAAFYRTHNLISEIPLPEDVGDFRLMDRRAVDALLAMPERVRFMKGLFAWVGFKATSVECERPARSAGKSKFNFWRLWNFALDGFTSFSTVPLKVWTYIGSCVALLSFIYASVIVFRTLWFGVDVPGYASLLVVMLFLGGVQLIGLGILGEYLGRVFLEVKRRPVYVVNRRYGFDKASAEAGKALRQEATDPHG